MRQRQRHGAGAVVEPSRPTSAQHTADAANGSADSRRSAWDDVFRSASAAEQRELLALANRQGVVYTHQLPEARSTEIPSVAPETAPHLLTNLLIGQTECLEPLRVQPIAIHDAQLDAAQREAVARAVQTPDLFLLQGFPGSGKSRVAAEIVGQAVARGDRVLLTAPQAAAVDRVLELLSAHDAACPMRLLAAEESLDGLPAHARDRTAPGQLDRLRNDTLRKARCAADEAANQYDRLTRLEPLWLQLLDLATARRNLSEQRDSLVRARAAVPGRVEAEAEAARKSSAVGDGSPFVARIWTALQERDRALAEATGARDRLGAGEREHRTEVETVTARLEALRPLAEAKENKRWWTGSFWRAAFQGDVAGEVHQLHARLDRAEAELAAVEEERRRLFTAEEEARARDAETLAGLVESEKAFRLGEIEARATALAAEEQSLAVKAETLSRELPEAVTELTETVLTAARDGWARRRWQAERRRNVLRDWIGCLERESESFVARLPGRCNVLAAPLAGLPETLPEKLDLLVLDGADRLTESELLRLTGLARRWVLIGHPETRPRPVEVRRPPSRFASPRSGAGGPANAWPAVFVKLWQRLHADPARLSYAWLEENGRLCCRLRPLTPEQTQWLESERLTDFPDIELRILSMPRAEPALAEVVFPPNMSVAEAKRFVLREVQETAVQPRGRSLWWVEEADRLVLRLADEPGNDFQPVPLGEGVREHVRRLPTPDAPDTWQTCCIEFDRSAGWQRSGAEEWVQQYLGLRDLGRTMRLEVCHRAGPDLGGFLSDVLFQGEMRPGHTAGHAETVRNGPAVEFIPVPPLQESGAVETRNGNTPSATLTRPHAALLARRSGAGLELDLADGRSRDRLPTDCRAGLPATGLVNYLEAQAVVRALEALAAEPDAANIPIGVAALYPAQAELIRLLISRSPALNPVALALRVDIPDGFAESEYPIMLVSLTRSHGHRAVPFGDEPAALALALTRPRQRLLLFGDAGTLVRRVQHEQSVEHLDAAASAREREVLLRLLRYLQGQGAHPRAFQVREGSTA